MLGVGEVSISCTDRGAEESEKGEGQDRGTRKFKDVGKILECSEDSRMFRKYWNVVKELESSYPNGFHRPAAPASPRNSLRSPESWAHAKPAGSESAFQHDLHMIHMHSLKTSLRCTGLKGWESSRTFRFHRHLKCIQERRPAETGWEGRKEEEDYRNAPRRAARPPLQRRARGGPAGGGTCPRPPCNGLPRRRTRGTNRPRA